MHPRALVALALVAVAGPADAGPIDGKLVLPPGGAPRPTAHGRGFLDPVDNPLLPVRAAEPFRSMAIVLEGGAATPPAVPTVQVAWDVLGDSFARPLIVVRIGTELKITNRGHGTPILTAVGQPALIAKKPLNPSGELVFNVGTEPRVLEIVDETAPHLRGRVLVTASTQVALPDANGKFTLADVPPGAWTLRVFYAAGNTAGWLDRTDDKLTVGAGRAAINAALPPGLPVKAP
jgi:hypothetical protein